MARVEQNNFISATYLLLSSHLHQIDPPEVETRNLLTIMINLLQLRDESDADRALRMLDQLIKSIEQLLPRLGDDSLTTLLVTTVIPLLTIVKAEYVPASRSGGV